MAKNFGYSTERDIALEPSSTYFSQSDDLEEKRMLDIVRFRGPRVHFQTLLKAPVDELVQRTLRADDAAVSSRPCVDKIVAWKRDVLLRVSLEAFTGERTTITCAPLHSDLL